METKSKLSIGKIEKLSGAPLRELKKELIRILPSIRLFVFGSYARGDFNLESDIDLLVVMPDRTTYKRKKELQEAITDFNFKHGVFVSSVFMEESRFENREVPLVVRVLEEGVEL